MKYIHCGEPPLPPYKERPGSILVCIRDTLEKGTGTVEKNLVGWHQTKVWRKH